MELTKIGRFESPDALLKAYTALGADYARKSRRIKELERQIAALKAKFEDAEERKKTALEALKDEQFVSAHVLPDENLKSRIIADYLRGIKEARSAAVLHTGCGASALTPPAKPRTLDDAKLLADIIMNS